MTNIIKMACVVVGLIQIVKQIVNQIVNSIAKAEAPTWIWTLSTPIACIGVYFLLKYVPSIMDLLTVIAVATLGYDSVYKILIDCVSEITRGGRSE